MEANTRHLEKIFDQTIQYQVPLFQRPYVWTKEANLEPLWDDIQALLDKHLRSTKAHSHFLGAVVLEQLANSTGSIESRQVIDGQQRFTTLQLFLIAIRDHAVIHDIPKYIERFGDMVRNRQNRIDHEVETFKVWPTNSDRAAFRTVHQAGSLAALNDASMKDPSLLQSNICCAYRYFYQQLTDWLSGALDDENAALPTPKNIADRLETLWQVVKGYLQLVVIDLDKDDETQVIFETLNARGEELLPADLIKNLLFRRAVAEQAQVEKLYELHWQRLETPFWREHIVQGRLKRPRIDVFISHYLTLMTCDEVKSSHLFNTFKVFVLNAEQSDGSLIPVPTTPSEHIIQLSRYSEVFKKFENAESDHHLATFIRRLAAVDTTTVYPFLLHAYAELMPKQKEEFENIVGVIESFLMRRMICGLTSKNYNRLFVDLIRAVEKSGNISKETVSTFLNRGIGDSVRFPSDKEFFTAASELPLYGRLAQYKVRAILEALDAFSYNRKSEVLALPSGLEIEHVLPRAWTTHWPLPQEFKDNPLEEQKAVSRRDALLNTIGNLTLITGTLNPTLSNSAWKIKHPELLKFSKLNLTQYFHEKEADTWDEIAIKKRTKYLAMQLISIWPGANTSEILFKKNETSSPLQEYNKPNNSNYYTSIDQSITQETHKEIAKKLKKQSLTPQSTYEKFLLYVLWNNFGGRARKNDVTNSIIALMNSMGFISEVELEKISTGETKAGNTIAWGRNNLKDQGFISKESQHGTWELTKDGIEKAKKTVLPNPINSDALLAKFLSDSSQP